MPGVDEALLGLIIIVVVFGGYWFMKEARSDEEK